jgi:flagellar biosynthesis/type III secretory pathway M-ring protein FliF/YscJ
MVLGVLALLALCGYLAVPVSSGIALLRNGQKFSIGEIIRISHALDAQRIDYRVDDQRRIEVAADRVEDARGVLAKLNIGPRSIEELDKEAQTAGPFDGPWEKELKQSKGQEHILAAMIREFDGIVDAYVTINRPKTRIGLGRLGSSLGVRATAFVWLETDGGREISHKTVQSIQNLIVGKEPELKADAVTVFDQKGRHYLVAGDPKYSTLSATRAREEELSQRILEEVDWVDGVRVTVQLIPAAAAAPIALPVLNPPPAPLPPTAQEPGPLVGVNAPLELEAEPRPGAETVAPALPVPGPVPIAAAPRVETARVWVRVPRSYYYSKAAPDREPAIEQLKKIAAHTESLIRVAVVHVVPPELMASDEPIEQKIKIDTIPDGEPPHAPLRSQVVTDSRRPLSWWVPAAGAGGGLIVLASALAVRVRGWRRPPHRVPRAAASHASHAAQFRRDVASESGAGPGPAERVRELIRRNPETAAGVLHRWIGQGESVV